MCVGTRMEAVDDPLQAPFSTYLYYANVTRSCLHVLCLQYTAFLWLLLETITNTNVVPPSFKPDQEIECIIDKDLSDSTTRIRSALADAGTR